MMKKIQLGDVLHQLCFAFKLDPTKRRYPSCYINEQEAHTLEEGIGSSWFDKKISGSLKSLADYGPIRFLYSNLLELRLYVLSAESVSIDPRFIGEKVQLQFFLTSSLGHGSGLNVATNECRGYSSRRDRCRSSWDSRDRCSFRENSGRRDLAIRRFLSSNDVVCDGIFFWGPLLSDVVRPSHLYHLGVSGRPL
ncbi:hypothetical protein TNCV_4550231 [Trichonephila clavipes]|nr:hypothetical protein TNCV_4550231 [Trichonephila clavipes]